ncbi:ABC transporter permease [Albidovulum sp.]
MGETLHPMTAREGRALRSAVLGGALLGLVLPILAGLWQTGRAAFGLLPAIGGEALSLAPWQMLLDLPGFATSLLLTLWTGFAATLLSLVLAFAFAAFLWLGRGGLSRPGLIAPLLATPHAALAIGLAFLIAPSGWIARLFSPWATGWTLPPDIATVQDGAGLALILGLTVKEVPFLLLVMLSALGQLPVRAELAAARALGYAPGIAWAKVIAPQLYALIRLPVFVVLSFSLSVVDMAIILGPSNPPTLAVAMTRWFFAADVARLLPASAAAVLLAAVVAAAIGLWIGAECVAGKLICAWIRRGGRGLGASPGVMLGGLIGRFLLGLGAAALAVLLLWSVAWRWPFPAALPESWSLLAWARPGAGWGAAAAETALVGVAATALALALAIAWLEGEDRAGLGRARWAEGLIYMPLLVPQVAFLYGLSVSFLTLGLAPGRLPVIWGHVLFVFPYVMIALSDPWRALDARLVRAAAALGAGPARRFWAVKLPLLLGPILTAAAIGFAVSVAQYLPTLFLGGGRVVTLTTEAVTLSSGSDRRITGVYAVLQAALPLTLYWLAIVLPAARRRRMAGGAAP